MRFSLLPSLVSVLLLSALVDTRALRAAEPMPTAAQVTERGRDIARILDMALTPSGPTPRRPPDTATDTAAEGRTVLLLLDVTTSLQKSDFPGELEAAIARNERALAGTRLAVGAVGESFLTLEPTTDRELAVRRVRELCETPGTAFRNVYGAVRRALGDLRKEPGTREIVLVTLENGDAEDDVEQTVTALRRADTRLSVICREAFLSDSYWALRPPRGPAGTRFTGSDAAFVDLPWGFRLQWGVPNHSVLSGFGMYGLTRLAAATDGRVYLYYPPTGLGHVCCGYRWCRCLFCVGDHAPEGSVYQAQRLRALAPLAGSREEVFRHAASDPYYKVVQRAWEQAARENLVYSGPSLETGGAVPRITRRPYRGWTPLGTTVALGSEIARAGRLAAACDRILETMSRDLERAREKGGLERYRAVAETTRLMLYVTRFNLLHYIAFCDEVAPERMRCGPDSYDPPERARHPPGGRFLYVGYMNLSLCHGVAPFRSVRFPGGPRLERERFALQVRWDAFLRRWNHTPYEAVVRRMGLTEHYLVRKPGYVPPGQRRVPDTETDETVTLPERPARPTRTGNGSSGGDGPASGG